MVGQKQEPNLHSSDQRSATLYPELQVLYLKNKQKQLKKKKKSKFQDKSSSNNQQQLETWTSRYFFKANIYITNVCLACEGKNMNRIKLNYFITEKITKQWL